MPMSPVMVRGRSILGENIFTLLPLTSMCQWACCHTHKANNRRPFYLRPLFRYAIFTRLVEENRISDLYTKLSM